jgi:UDP-glucose 4-epimerase
VRALVTGGKGFIGQAVVRALLADGHQVDVMSRTSDRGRLPEAAAVLVADITDRAEVRKAIGTTPYQAVVHLAALTNARESFDQPVRYYDVNVGGTANLLDALAASGSEPPRLVLASTNNVYGTRGGALSEDLELHPESPYAASKVAAEQLVTYQAATGALAATVLRLFNVAGAIDGITDTDARRLIPAVLAVAAGERPTFAVNGDGGAVREYTHVRDAAAAVVVALAGGETSDTRCYNVGTGRGVTVLDVIRVTEHVTGRTITVEHRSARPEPRTLVADPRRIMMETVWQPSHSELTAIVADAWKGRAGLTTIRTKMPISASGRAESTDGG